MQAKKFLSSLLITAGLTCFALAGPAWGQQGCIDPRLTFPDPVDQLDSTKYIYHPDNAPPAPPVSTTYDDTEYSIPSPTVSEFGSNLTCDDIAGQFGGVIPNGDGAVTFQDPVNLKEFTVMSFVDNGIAKWNVISLPPSSPEYTVLNAIDTSITDSAQGGNGCLAIHNADAVAGRLSYQKSNGTNTLRNLYVCANETFDAVGIAPPASAPPVEGCNLSLGETIDIYGVTISCNNIDPGQQRTIFVSQDTEGGEAVPGYGFINGDGDIDFNNVCVCNGDALNATDPEPFVDEQCDPNPEGTPPDPALGDLPDCTLEEGTKVGVSVDILNPRCVTVGGRRRCY